MVDWRIQYKRDYLETIINRKRYDRGIYEHIKPERVERLIHTKMKEAKLNRLDATNALINEVREGREL